VSILAGQLRHSPDRNDILRLRGSREHLPLPRVDISAEHIVQINALLRGIFSLPRNIRPYKRRYRQ
jgi:hypothetical protein